ncbi:MAG: hypothetical protein ABS889_08185 [Desemzia incerta]
MQYLFKIFVIYTHKRREKPAVEVKSREMFFRVASAAFALRRKTMLNNLCATFRAERAQALSWLEAAGLDEKIRGEKLTLEEILWTLEGFFGGGALSSRSVTPGS